MTTEEKLQIAQEEWADSIRQLNKVLDRVVKISEYQVKMLEAELQAIKEKVEEYER